MDISKNGRTVVMATHQHDLLKKFPARTLECKDGKVIEISNPKTDVEEELELD